jgi:hypothetical protein
MQFENLYQDLANGAEIIRALLLGVTSDEAHFKPNADTWSILEVVCHLYDEEREDFRQRLDIILHRATEPLPPIHPGAWVSERRYNERDLAESLAAFLAEREQSLTWLKNLSAPNWAAEYTNQSRSIKAGEMLASWVAHDNLHTRQLVELRRERLVKLAAPFDVGYAGDW